MTTFDFDKIATEAAKSREPRQEAVRLNGTFNVEVAYASGTTRKANGDVKNPTVGVKWKVLDGPQAGEEAWYNLTLTEASKAIFGRNCLELGVPESILRSFGQVNGEESMLAALKVIAEGLIAARYNITVAPQVKRPDFDNTVINTIVEAPDFSDSAESGAGPAVVPQTLADVAQAHFPPAAPAFAPASAATQPLPSAAVPVGVPGGWVPNLQ